MSLRLNILLLADDRHPALTLIDHVQAFAAHSSHRWIVANPMHEDYVNHLDLRAFDAVVIHYSLCVIFDTYLPPGLRGRIAAYRGLKLQFIQDEYRWVNRVSERVADLGIDVLFTLVPPAKVERAYNNPRLRSVRKVSTLPGFIPDHLANYPVTAIRERSLHIAYRSRRLPYWLGDLGQDKIRIAEGVLRRAPAHGLRFDIDVDESARIYGAKWFQFVASAKTVLGTEGGASIWDYDSKVQEMVETYLAHHPGAPYEEVAPLLKPYEGNMMYNTMSPRVFEAAALRTAMVMFPGWYDGVVEPGSHYIALQKDFSNFGEVADKLKDDGYLQALVDRTYDEIVRPGRYSKRAFVRQVDEVIEESIDSKRTSAVSARLPKSSPDRAIRSARRTAKVNSAIRWLYRMAARVARGFVRRVDRALVLFAKGWKVLRARDLTVREKCLLILDGCWSLLPAKLKHWFFLASRRLLPKTIVQTMQTTRRSVRRHPPGFQGVQRDYQTGAKRSANARTERVLFIALFDPNGIPTIPEQIAQWCRSSRFQFDLLNLANLSGETGIEVPAGIEFAGYDALLFHSTISYNVENLYSLDRRLRGKITDFPGVKVLMKQDEHYRTYVTAEFIGSRKIDLVLTLTRPTEVRLFYPPERTGDGVRFMHYFTSFITEEMTAQRSPPLKQRRIDVSYRGSLQPWHFGRLAHEKADIGERFRAPAHRHGLVTDISSRWEDRHFGAAWIDFMCRSRAVLGVEGGASIVDFTGEVERATKDYLRRFPAASFEQVWNDVLKSHEDNCYYKTISPRIFEAASCRCMQVLYEGDYSAVLEAGRHYIALRRDFANVDDVIRQLRDSEHCQSLVDRAFEEIVLNPRYSHDAFVDDFDSALSAAIEAKGSLARGPKRAELHLSRAE